MDKQLQEAIQFFKSENAYRKLFKQFKKKYESLGRIGGTVAVDSYSEKDLEEIGGFFGVPGGELRSKGSISVVAFEQQLQHTRFSGTGLKQLLDAFFGESILSNREQRLEKEQKLHRFILDLKERFKELDFWFETLLKKQGEARWIIVLVEKDAPYFEQLVTILAHAYRALPETAERLPMFSQRIAGNPHAFDIDTDLGKLFLHVLAVDWSNDSGDSVAVVPSTTEAVNEMLQHYHIYRDDLLNFVTCANFYAEKADGSVHRVWKAAVECNTVQNLPLRELVSLDRVYPAKGNDVWIVENSGVCSTLLDYEPAIPIICTNGQFKLAALILMDLLTEEGCILHYAGDFDPEGLGMAQRLLARYPDDVKLWRMDLKSYQQSDPVKQLDQKRLVKLSGIVQDDLRMVADVMERHGKAGYQEALVDVMMQDVREKM